MTLPFQHAEFSAPVNLARCSGDHNALLLLVLVPLLLVAPRCATPAGEEKGEVVESALALDRDTPPIPQMLAPNLGGEPMRMLWRWWWSCSKPPPLLLLLLLLLLCGAIHDTSFFMVLRRS